MGCSQTFSLYPVENIIFCLGNLESLSESEINLCLYSKNPEERVFGAILLSISND